MTQLQGRLSHTGERPAQRAAGGPLKMLSLAGTEHPNLTLNRGVLQRAPLTPGKLPPPVASADQARSNALAQKAARICNAEALADARRALKCQLPQEVQQLRWNSAAFTALAKSLQIEGVR
jgi:hypothetical protein